MAPKRVPTVQQKSKPKSQILVRVCAEKGVKSYEKDEAKIADSRGDLRQKRCNEMQQIEAKNADFSADSLKNVVQKSEPKAKKKQKIKMQLTLRRPHREGEGGLLPPSSPPLPLPGPLPRFYST